MIFDTILELDNNLVNEKKDPRLGDLKIGTKTISASPEFTGQAWFMNPYDNFSLGSYVRSGLESLGRGFSTQVFDFGSDIMIHIEYYDIGTCKTAGANFLIKILNKKGEGCVKSSSNRYRTITTIGEAISYISSRAKSLSSYTNNNS